MNIVAVIPARAGSSLKDKNVYPLGGYPLLAWSIACAKMSCHINSVCIYTDSLEYGKVAKKYGADWLTDNNPLIGKVPNHVFIKEWLRMLEASTGRIVDYVVILWATTPLRDVEYVDAAITGFLVNQQATSLKSVVEMSESAYKAMRVEKGWLVSLSGDTANVPRQQIPKTYHPNGYVDVMKGELLRKGEGWGDKVLPFLCDDVGEIDTEKDIKQVERLLSERIGWRTLEYLRGAKTV